jgi:hypothetical protein
MGVVYKAQGFRLDHFVAPLSSADDVARDPQALSRFQLNGGNLSAGSDR